MECFTFTALKRPLGHRYSHEPIPFLDEKGVISTDAWEMSSGALWLWKKVESKLDLKVRPVTWCPRQLLRGDPLFKLQACQNYPRMLHWSPRRLSQVLSQTQTWGVWTTRQLSLCFFPNFFKLNIVPLLNCFAFKDVFFFFFYRRMLSYYKILDFVFLQCCTAKCSFLFSSFKPFFLYITYQQKFCLPPRLLVSPPHLLCFPSEKNRPLGMSMRCHNKLQ